MRAALFASVVALAALLGACVTDSLVACADGVLCPAGYTCHPTYVCVSPAQVAACANTPDGVRCLEDGVCNAGACLVADCGNDVREPQEACDDGNRVDGDGCSATCMSDEACGNAIVDFLIGEDCDDGNTRNRDGCGATCIAEPLEWQPIAQANPAPREATALVYDVARDRAVLFGGDGVADLDDTWELAGSEWTEHARNGILGGRSGHAMAYDGRRGRVVLFGGVSYTVESRDTAEYDGVQWRIVPQATGPSARSRHAMAYDAVRDRVVLFGGRTGSTVLGDTWLYDGVEWTELDSPVAPPARADHGMAFDPQRGRIVLFGGRGTAALRDTWELGPDGWTQVATTGPPAGLGRAIAFAPAHGVLVFSTSVLNIPYAWDGVRWTELPTQAGPRPDGDRFAAAYDPVRARVVAFSASPIGQAESWELADGVWKRLQQPPQPARHQGAAVAYDVMQGRVVMFGGIAPDAKGVDRLVADTWVLTGDTWRLHGASGPSPRRFSALAYAADVGGLVLFGGVASPDVLADTWAYRSTGWTRLEDGPLARHSSGLAYDLALDRLVLHGGSHADGVRDDTWKRTGTAWAYATGALPLAQHHVAYDAARGRVVAFGGVSPDVSSETYEYDGTRWKPLAVAARPPPRSAGAVVYDPVSAQLLVTGGAAVNAAFDDLWSLRGDVWTRLAQPSVTPTPLLFRGMAYDIAGRRAVLGVDGSPARAWALAYAATTTEEACGSGIDYDGDGAIGCADDECWTVCAPLCPPDSAIPDCDRAPTCGDGTCQAYETCRGCPSDCLVGEACPVRCGDFFCDAGEDCPGDCL